MFGFDFSFHLFSLQLWFTKIGRFCLMLSVLFAVEMNSLNLSSYSPFLGCRFLLVEKVVLNFCFCSLKRVCFLFWYLFHEPKQFSYSSFPQTGNFIVHAFGIFFKLGNMLVFFFSAELIDTIKHEYHWLIMWTLVQHSLFANASIDRSVSTNFKNSLCIIYIATWLLRFSPVFVYDRNQMNVLEVNKTDYESCNSDHPLHNWTTGAGRDVVPLNVTRHYYFISGKGFCYGGMKLAVRVENPPPPPSASPIKEKSGTPSTLYRGQLVLPAVFAIGAVWDAFVRFW